ncbi:MAG: dephospho-CoA kinase [Clostridia bacterium]
MRQNNHLIAIAGGIGSGKSEVMSILKEAGASIIMTDEINRRLLQDESYIKKLQEVFPYAFNSGFLNKTVLKERIFSDNNERKKLNATAHSAIIREVELASALLPPPVFVEIPLIIESGTAHSFEQIWAVRSPLEERVRRIVLRDGLTEEFAKSIIRAQKGEDKIFAIANVIIDNSGDKSSLKEKILQIYSRYLQAQ